MRFRQLLFVHLWNSPTCMTWGSYFARSLNLILVLPILLRLFSSEEIALWLIFTTIISLQAIFDIGLTPTFSRVIAYAMAGAEIDDLKIMKGKGETKSNYLPNWKTIESICSNMQICFLILSFIVFLCLITLGTFSVMKPIAVAGGSRSLWIAWWIIVVASSIILFGYKYFSYLQGLNHIALLRRWEILTSLGSTFTICFVLFLGGRILEVVAAHQAWRVLNVLINSFLAAKVNNAKYRTFKTKQFNDKVFDAIWPSAWRSGLGIFLTRGTIYASGLVYAQLGNTTDIASFLLGLNLIYKLRDFSNAPFYTKLPVLNRLKASNNEKILLKTAQRGMFLSHLTFVVGFIALGLFGRQFLNIIHSNVEFPSDMLWFLLGFALLIQKYGAMHLHLYSTTNHIIWHKANFIFGVIYIAFSILLYKSFSFYAFPISMVIGFLFFYSWYSAFHSYKEFRLDFWIFEKRVLPIPLAMLILFMSKIFASY